jgi:hypothetical protein
MFVKLDLELQGSLSSLRQRVPWRYPEPAEIIPNIHNLFQSTSNLQSFFSLARFPTTMLYGLLPLTYTCTVYFIITDLTVPHMCHYVYRRTAYSRHPFSHILYTCQVPRQSPHKHFNKIAARSPLISILTYCKDYQLLKVVTYVFF